MDLSKSCENLELHQDGLSGLFPSRQISCTQNSGYVEPLLPPLRHPKSTISVLISTIWYTTLPPCVEASRGTHVLSSLTSGLRSSSRITTEILRYISIICIASSASVRSPICLCNHASSTQQSMCPAPRTALTCVSLDQRCVNLTPDGYLNPFTTLLREYRARGRYGHC
jgi:hypothetical protein